MKSSSTIVLAVAVLYGTTLSKQVIKGEPVTPWRPLIGALGVGFFLSLIAAGNDKIATSMSWLVIVSSVLINGQPLLSKISGIGGKPKPTRTRGD